MAGVDLLLTSDLLLPAFYFSLCLVLVVAHLVVLHGQGQNRTADTVIFSHVLYQLSYLAQPDDKHKGVGVAVPPRPLRPAG